MERIYSLKRLSCKNKNNKKLKYNNSDNKNVINYLIHRNNK
jgi:hypothetical protein